jgi:hypothetical protein
MFWWQNPAGMLLAFRGTCNLCTITGVGSVELWMQFYVGLEKYMEWNATTMLIFMLEAECKPWAVVIGHEMKIKMMTPWAAYYVNACSCQEVPRPSPRHHFQCGPNYERQGRAIQKYSDYQVLSVDLNSIRKLTTERSEACHRVGLKRSEADFAGC